MTKSNAQSRWGAAMQGMVDRLRTHASPPLPEESLAAAKIAPIFARLPILVFALDADRRPVFWNEECVRLLGYTPEEVLNNPGILPLVFPDAEYRRTVVERAGGVESFVNLEIEALTKGGTSKVLALTAAGSVFPIQGWADWFVGTNITQVTKTEEALWSQAMLLEQIGDQLWVADLEGAIRHVNPATCEALKCTRQSLMGAPVKIHAPVPPHANITPQVLKTVREQGAWSGEAVAFRGDGTPVFQQLRIWLTHDANGEPAGLCGLATDISAQKEQAQRQAELEAQLLQARKMESLGLLASGLAHDFNNLLMSILGNLELARLELDSPDQMRACCQEIESAARHGSDLCRQLLAYTGKAKAAREAVQLSNLVREMRELMAISVSRKAQVQLNLADALPLVSADPIQLRQVLMNLLTNAADAIRGDYHGNITVQTGRMLCDRAYLLKTNLGMQAPEGEYVFLEITDNGSGMDEATAQKIFDPFFTTKPQGRGLGLPMVWGIVRAHQGAIAVHSKKNVGTTIRVLFPVSTQPAADVPPAPDEECAWRGEGMAILADDEESLRKLGQKMLERLGFQVKIARHAAELVQRLEDVGGQARFVISDMSLLCQQGMETLALIRQRYPHIPLAIASGFSEEEVQSRLGEYRLEGYIQKPYRGPQLAALLKRLTAAAPP